MEEVPLYLRNGVGQFSQNRSIHSLFFASAPNMNGNNKPIARYSCTNILKKSWTPPTPSTLNENMYATSTAKIKE